MYISLSCLLQCSSNGLCCMLSTLLSPTLTHRSHSQRSLHPTGRVSGFHCMHIWRYCYSLSASLPILIPIEVKLCAEQLCATDLKCSPVASARVHLEPNWALQMRCPAPWLTNFTCSRSSCAFWSPSFKFATNPMKTINIHSHGSVRSHRRTHLRHSSR